MATPDERSAFATALRRLRDLRGLSRVGLAQLLATQKNADGEPLVRTPQAIAYWEDGSYAPDRHTVVTLETVLDAPGELLPLLGYGDEDTILRIAALEREVREIRRLVGRLERGLRDV